MIPPPVFGLKGHLPNEGLLFAEKAGGWDDTAFFYGLLTIVYGLILRCLLEEDLKSLIRQCRLQRVGHFYSNGWNHR